MGVSEYKIADRNGTEYAATDAKNFFAKYVEHGKRIYTAPDSIQGKRVKIPLENKGLLLAIHL